MNVYIPFKNKIITGKELKATGLTFIKFTNDMMKHNGFKYKIGKNTDIYPLTYDKWDKGGLYFCSIKKFYYYLDFGNGFHIVTFDDDEEIFVEENAYKARTITLGKKYISKI